MDAQLERRVLSASRFRNDNYLNTFNMYYDVMGQVHSVVETQNGNIILRIWKSTQKFGPKHCAKKWEQQIFRVTQENFKRYICRPDPRIGKLIQDLGNDLLIEIDLYDEHRKTCEKMKSGEFVAITNVHSASKDKIFQCQVLHGGTRFGRGISKIPENYKNDEFQKMKMEIEMALWKVRDFEDFEEFHGEPDYIPIPDIRHSGISENLENSEISKSENPCRKVTVGEEIAVDFFAKRSDYKYHFLSHAHTDHRRGLDKNWTKKVYCSRKTAIILPHLMGYTAAEPIPPDLIHPLDLNVPIEFPGFRVTLIDANHCPGAVMFIFQGPKIPGNSVLVTGDFRADHQFLKEFKNGGKFEWITHLKFSTIFLDNTYLSLNMRFPLREEALELLVEKLRSLEDRNIYIPLNFLGREDLIESLSRLMNEPISVYHEREIITSLLDFQSNYGISNPLRTIEIVQKNQWRSEKADQTQKFAVFDISMLRNLIGNSRYQEENPNYETVHIPYSDHCSRYEILEFLRLFNFLKVIPIAKKATDEDLHILNCCSRRHLKNQEPSAIPNPMENLENEQLEHLEPRKETPPPSDPPFKSPTSKKMKISENDEDGEELDLMNMNFSDWPDGPPKTLKEAIERAKDYRRKKKESNLKDVVTID